MVPDLTVVICVYNMESFIKEAIDSVLTQKGCSLKLILVNDGSSDGSAGILEKIRDPRVGVIHKKNSGLGASRNFAISLCKTKYVAWMDADDISLHGRFAAQLQALEANRDVGMVGTQVEYFTVDTTKRLKGSSLPYKHEDIVAGLGKKPVFCSASAMFRIELLQRTGGFRISGAGQDIDWLFRMSEVTQLMNLSATYYLQRFHEHSTHHRFQRKLEIAHAYARDCARRRARRETEVSLECFLAEKQHYNGLRKIILLRNCLLSGLHRKYVIHRLSGNYWKAACAFFGACLLGPGRVMRRSTQVLYKRFKP